LMQHFLDENVKCNQIFGYYTYRILSMRFLSIQEFRSSIATAPKH
jgi:hypothetical protein